MMDISGALTFNSIVWVLGNVVVLVIFIAALAFSLLYPVLFNPALTTAGKLIWRAILSVAGFGLLTVLGVWINGSVEPWEIPPYVEWWRPIIRLIVYGFIGYTFASLVWLLIVRRFWPERVKTVPETEASTLNVKPRDLRRG